MNQPAISVQNVSKIYRVYSSPKDRFLEVVSNGRHNTGKDHYALRNVSFDVAEGEIMGIVGVNGSGKSTLLKIITGVLSPSEGTVAVNGKISALLELGAGFNPEYSGIDNIYFNGMVMGFSREEMTRKLNGIIDFADIGEYIYQPVRTYSSGMYVRLAYAVAVSIEPDILIVDEALSVGDAYFQMKSMSKMQELFRKGKTVLFVSHDTASVKNLCNTAIYLNNGEILAYGKANDVVDLYEAHVRERMSNTGKNIKQDAVPHVDTTEMQSNKKGTFLIDSAYLHRVGFSREGNGKAQICALQLLDQTYKPVTEVMPFGTYIIRMFIDVKESCTMCVGYHIRDDKNNPILGSNTLMEQGIEVSASARDKLIVEFETKLPLRDGRYNIMTVLSHTLYQNRSAEFIDVTKDGLYFDVLEAKPIRIWNTVQLPNRITVSTLESPREEMI